MNYTLRKFLIRSFYFVMKALGLFHLSRKMTKDGIRILGYHGFTMVDEEKFVPGLFISPQAFEQRLRYLADKKFPVLSLQEADKRRANGTLPDCATVITIDDGFYSVYRHAAEPLRRFGFPSTLYLTTYYFDKQTPFFNLIIDYMCWKSRKPTVELASLAIPALADFSQISLSDDRRRQIAEAVKEYAKRLDDEATRCRIAEQLGDALDIDYPKLVDSRFLSTIDAGELREMLEMGMDVQLHTHRHRLPLDPALAVKEIEDNRASISAVVSQPLDHFCYPSGEWSPDHWAPLQTAGAKTATTCESGLVYGDTPRFALNRILDSARIAQIEFEAEMSGFTELVRRVRRGRNKPSSPLNADNRRNEPSHTTGMPETSSRNM